jgi:NADH-quinone oxidoreductase subunit E
MESLLENKQDESFAALLAERRGERGALIPILQEAQNIYGYLSDEVIRQVAVATRVPLAEVFGVVTFYSQFRRQRAGENLIRVCMGTACHVRGALQSLRSLEKSLAVKAGETTADGRFSLETVNCIGACGLAPVMTVNSKVYGNLTPEKAAEITGQFE